MINKNVLVIFTLVFIASLSGCKTTPVKEDNSVVKQKTQRVENRVKTKTEEKTNEKIDTAVDKNIEKVFKKLPF